MCVFGTGVSMDDLKIFVNDEEKQSVAALGSIDQVRGVFRPVFRRAEAGFWAAAAVSGRLLGRFVPAAGRCGGFR